MKSGICRNRLRLITALRERISKCASAGNGDGIIETNESACATEHLIRAGLIRGDPAAPIVTRFGALSLTGAGNIAGFNPPSP